jgi:polygalacturonase
VLDFGAGASGETDSSAAIQAAIAEASSRMRWLPGWLWLPRSLRRLVQARRTVHLPAGTYAIRNTLAAAPGVTLEGERGNKEPEQFLTNCSRGPRESC